MLQKHFCIQSTFNTIVVLHCLTLFILLFYSCSEEHVPAMEQINVNMEVSLRSINKDSISFEDRVNEVRVIVSRPNTGEIVLNTTLDFPDFDLSGSATPILLKSGTYDFLFIANEKSFDGLSTQLNQITNLNMLYKMATLYTPTNGFIPTKEKPFLMSAFYQDILVAPAGDMGKTIQNPISFTHLNANNNISFVRAFAKVELIGFNGGGYGQKSISKMSLLVPETFTFPANGILTEIGSTSITYEANFLEGSAFQIDADYPYSTDNLIGGMRLYVPEFFSNNGSISLLVEGSGFNPKKLELTTSQNEWNCFQQTAIPNYQYSPAPSQSILRNIHYRVNATLINEDISLNTEVLPWTLNTCETDFSEAVFDIRFAVVNKDGTTKYLQPDFTNKTIEISTGQKTKIYFELSAPKGGLWRSSITNGLEFNLTPTDEVNYVGATTGIARSGSWYSFEITPSKTWDGTPRFTELIITVNNEEIQLLSGVDETGVGRRVVIKQIE